MRDWRALLLCVAAVGFLACDGSTGTSSVNGPSSPSQGLLTATVDGSSFVAVPSSITASNSNGIVKFAGSDGGAGSSARTIELTIVAAAPGVFPIGFPSGTLGTSAVLTQGTARWVADTTMGNGSITLNVLTSSSASGTFLFNAEPVAATGAAITRVVTGGTFNVAF
jgi:hypothetical protein